MEKLCDELEIVGRQVVARDPKLYDLIINVPPGSSKSTIATVVFPCWLWILDPTIRKISASHSLELSTEHAGKSRDLLGSEKFRELFGEVTMREDRDNKRTFENNSKGTRIVASVGSKITGKHAHILIVDDPIDPEGGHSDVKREAANRWVGQTLSTRKVDKKVTPLVMIMQRLHEEDPTGHLLAKGKGTRVVSLPGEITDKVRPKPEEYAQFYTDGLLDPDRFDREVLAEMKIDLGSYGYANQVLQLGAPPEGGIFKIDWFKVISFEEFLSRTSNKNVVWNFKVDGAYTEKTMNDPSGFWASTFVDGTLYVRSFQEKRLEFPEFVSFTKEFAQSNGYNSRSVVHIEPKANGLSAIQMLQRNSGVNVAPYKFPKTAKISMQDDKITRANACSATCEGGNVVFIDSGNVHDTISNICNFPNAAHDEAVDCLVMDVAAHYLGREKRGMRRRN